MAGLTDRQRQLLRTLVRYEAEGRSGRRPCRLRGLVVKLDYSDTPGGRRLKQAVDVP